jgi:hypothetical protein
MMAAPLCIGSPQETLALLVERCFEEPKNGPFYWSPTN